MALKQLCTLVCVTGVVAYACNRSAPPASVTKEAPRQQSVTGWTEKTELFAEYPPLAVGATSRFAIHMTRLDSFQPVTDGRVEVHLRGGNGADEVFLVDGPSRPGIFGVDVTPAHAGTRELVIVLRSVGVEDEHRIGEVVTHANAAEAAAETSAEDATGISFLKEQQWSLDFGTALVREQTVRESTRVPALIVARPGGTADVVAPIDGRLARVLDVALGARVSRGQELGGLLPPPAVPGDLPQLELARAEAQSALALATRDRERAERLTNAGAAPERRLDEARSAEELARARLNAALARLTQYNTARTAGVADGDGLFVIRAPLSGTIARRDATTGANVTGGTILFRVVDTSQVHVVGQVPEAQAARVRLVTAAEMEIAGREGRLPAGRLASVGQVLEPQSRTLPITFELDNRPFGFPIGQAVSLHLLMEANSARPVVPAAAVVDDGGRPIVFVQRAGETFERRAVTLGARTGDVMQIADGVKPGERVVTKGAYLLRLASLSMSVPASGHVH